VARDRAPIRLGYVDLAIFIAMMPTSLIAAQLGVCGVSEAWLRRIYTLLLFVIVADLIRKLVRPTPSVSRAASMDIA
jgi:uncharacterized membrane protein YfcA